MDYLLEPEPEERQLDSLLDDELSTVSPEWPCNQGAAEATEDALKRDD